MTIKDCQLAPGTCPTRAHEQDHQDHDLTRVADEIANKVAAQLIEGALSISPAHADYLARGGQWYGNTWIGHPAYQVHIDYRMSNGQLYLELRTGAQEVMWRGTLQCNTPDPALRFT